MIKEAHVSLDVSFFDQNYEAIYREIDAYFITKYIILAELAIL